MVGSSVMTAQEHLVQAGFGALPAGWGIVEIGDLLSDDRGISVGVMYPGEHCPAGVPLIKAGDLSNNIINPRPQFQISREKHCEYRRTEFQGGEILMTLVGDVGQCAIVPPSMVGWNSARAVAVIRLADASDAHFVRQCLLSRPIQHLMEVWCNTTVQATLNLKEIKQLPLPWPPKKQRDAIAAFGRSLDDKIELNRRMNETLEAMARAIFKSWFVDFDPVRAKIDGRDPDLPKPVADLFPDSFDNSELGPIPSGWRVQTLGDAAAINARSIKRDYPREVIKYIDISSVTVGRLVATTEYQIDSAPSRAQRLVAHGDTIWSCVRPNRKSFLFIHQPDETLVVSTGFAVLTPKLVPPCYLYAWVTTDDFVDYLSYNADGSAYPAVRPDRFAAAAILLPPKPILDQFEAIGGRLRDRIATNERESLALAAIRDALLPKLLNGQLQTVPRP